MTRRLRRRRVRQAVGGAGGDHLLTARDIRSTIRDIASFIPGTMKVTHFDETLCVNVSSRDSVSYVTFWHCYGGGDVRIGVACSFI